MNTQKILTRSIAALLALASVEKAGAASGNYTATAAGSWGTAANWSSNPTVPGTTAGDIININSNIAAAATVTLDGTRTMGTLLIGDLDSTTAFTIATGTGGTLRVPYGKIQNALTTLEHSVLEPDVVELKVYGPGLGIVYSNDIAGGSGTAKLVSVTG